MSLLIPESTSGLRKIGALEYESLNDDPSFLYRFWLRRPRFLVVFLQATDDSLDPKLYMDRGNGFDENAALSLPEAGACIYVIRVLAPYRVSAIRLDPRSSVGRFRYWAKAAQTESEFDERLAEARAFAGGEASVTEITVDGTPEKRTKRRSSIKVPEHYAAALRLAERLAPSISSAESEDGPIISFVVPVFNAVTAHLDELLASFRRQPAGSAELILSDDGSTAPETLSWMSKHELEPAIRVVRKLVNRGIAPATNAGIDVARGTWIGLLDHDDALSPLTVQLIAQTAREHPRCQFIYTDEVVTDDKLKPVSYFLKPAYDDVLLSGVNYINHLSCYRRERLLALGGLRDGYNGSQDYELLLRYLRGLAPDDIRHLPYPAYLWRRSASAFSARRMDEAVAGARKALAERYGRDDREPPVDEAITKILHRVRFDTVERRWPRVSVVIPNKDSLPLIARVIDDVTRRTDYPDLEIIIADNGTTDRRVLALYAQAAAGAAPFRADVVPAPFNFSRQVNRGIALATGELVLLLNNDVEVVDRGWLSEMVSCFDYAATGIVGARLLYPNRRIQHAGVIVGLGGLAGHWYGGKRESFPGPMGRLHVRQSLSAVTGACMLISKTCLEAVGPFDEEEFGIAYNDVDFCLRAAAKGFRTVGTPFATLIHHESVTRGSDETPANRARFARDKDALRRRHGTATFEDRAFSPWYTRNGSEPGLRLLDRLPKAR